MAGTAISRLNPTDQVREKPSPSAAAIVNPLRLTPGNGANICARPIKSASSQVVCAGPFSPSGPLQPVAHQQEHGRRDQEAHSGGLAALEHLLEPLLEEEGEGNQRRRGDRREQPDPEDRRPVEARRHVRRVQQESPRALPDRVAIVEENRRQRSHVQHDVEEQVLLPAARLARQPGERHLRDRQVAVAGDRQELGDPLNHPQNQ